MSRWHGDMPLEIEATLVVLWQDPESVFGMIAGLSSIGTYRLEGAGTVTVEDTYYDTPSMSLMRSGAAVRIRRMGDLVLFCAKQDERTDASGAATRHEWESAWSRRCIPLITAAAAENAAEVSVDFCEDAPGRTLEQAGLRPIQTRVTVRRKIRAREGSSPEDRVVALVCLDTVSYEMPGGTFIHREIEVEASEAPDAGHVHVITRLLQEYLGDAVKPWPHNKLITGFALQFLESPRGSRRPGTPTRDLGPDDYKAIGTIISALQPHLQGSA